MGSVWHTTLAFVIEHIPTKFKVGWSSIVFLLKCLASVNGQLVVYSSMYSIVYWFTGGTSVVCVSGWLEKPSRANHSMRGGYSDDENPAAFEGIFEPPGQIIVTSEVTPTKDGRSSPQMKTFRRPHSLLFKCLNMIFWTFEETVVLFSPSKAARKTATNINMVDFVIWLLATLPDELGA